MIINYLINLTILHTLCEVIPFPTRKRTSLEVLPISDAMLPFWKANTQIAENIQ